MLEALLRSPDAERVLLFLTERGSGYGREIADFWATSVTGIQRRPAKPQAGSASSAMVPATRASAWPVGEGPVQCAPCQAAVQWADPSARMKRPPHVLLWTNKA